MFKFTLLAATSLGLLAAACAAPPERQASVPYHAMAQTTSERNCSEYGFAPGTAPFQRCVEREARARQAGRVNRDYAEARVFEDARNACYDYGLERGSQRYDSCVTREVDARSYRAQNETPAPINYATPNYATPTTGVAVSQDEFGFRYDGYGNRLDRNGRIISPQSTTR